MLGEVEGGVIEKSVASIWGNRMIPVIGAPHRRGELRVRIPFSRTNRMFLRVGAIWPSWNKRDKCWDLPRAHLDRVARRIVGVYGSVYVIQTRRDTETCAPACWNADGLECECACNGASHGSANDDGWYVVSDSFACKSGDKHHAVRLLAEKVTQNPTDEILAAASGVPWSTYFASAGNMLIKIGKSTDVDRRLRGLQTASPTKLKLIGVLNGDVESNYHQAFAHLRVSGEWFQFNEHELLTLREILFGAEDGN